MLPNVSGLRLDGRPLVSTGEFWPLSAAEVKERNAGGNQEAFTADPFREDTEPVDGWHTFRVRAEYPRADDTYDYSYYRGESLWEYLKRGNKRDPLTRGPIWYEDYMDLHDKFAPREPLHPWAANLPRKAPAPAPQPSTVTPSEETLQEQSEQTFGTDGPAPRASARMTAPAGVRRPDLTLELQTARRRAPGAPMARLRPEMDWNWWVRTFGGTPNADQPNPAALTLTDAQAQVIHNVIFRMAPLVRRYVTDATLQGLGRAENMRQAQAAFLSSPATSYDAALLFVFHADAFAESDGGGYYQARVALYNMIRAFTITMREPAARNAAFEERILTYLHTVVRWGGQTAEWIERDEGFMGEPPVLDDFRAALATYTRERLGGTSADDDGVERQMGQLTLDNQPAAAAPPPAPQPWDGSANWETMLANARERNEGDAAAAVRDVRNLFWQPNRALLDGTAIPGAGLAIDLNNALEHLLINWTRFPLPDRNSAAWSNLESLVFESLRVFSAQHLLTRHGVWDELRLKLIRFLTLVLAASSELRERARPDHWRNPVLTYLSGHPDADAARELGGLLQPSE